MGKKVSKIALIKNRKELSELFKMGQEYDNETDPEKKAALEAEITRRCDALKGKLQPGSAEVSAGEEDSTTPEGVPNFAEAVEN